jgi:hypothetical protein
MSNPFAIAAVTATFSQLLLRVIEEPTLAGVAVTTGAPDMARADSTRRQLNLFLYQVTPSAALRNMDLPFRNSAGDLSSRPVLALGLQYLLTAYGQNDAELDAHHLLAHAMSLVHDEGVLGREQIRAAIAAEPAVAQSDLADQVELVKLCPQMLSVDEISRLWTMYQTTNYRLSVGYEASVVLIERPQPTRTALPVRTANLQVVPFRQPVLERVEPQVALPGQTLRLTGRNLAADAVTLRFGATLATPSVVADRQVEVALPAALRAGVNTVQVVHELLLGTPPAPHRGFESNVAAFVLAPRVTTTMPVSVALGEELTLGFDPPVDRGQQVSILLGDREIAAPVREPDTEPVATLDIPISPTFPTGTYLLRLRVDGAESQLDVDQDPSSPSFNQYSGPKVTVTP